jgi:hypothetical protein
LLRAIPERQCTRGDNDDQPITNAELQRLQETGTGQGVHVMLMTERTAMAWVLTWVIDRNTRQMGEPAPVRFSAWPG